MTVSTAVTNRLSTCQSSAKPEAQGPRNVRGLVSTIATSLERAGTISHDESALELPGFRHAVEGLSRRGQLAGLLCQLPQATHCTRRTCDWITTLAKELGHLHLAVEFRHRSWFDDGVLDLLHQTGARLLDSRLKAFEEIGLCR